MTHAISATTRLFTLLGDPVAHSRSPAFQNAAIRHLGLDAVYLALRCDAASVGPLVRALCRAGGGGNVTVPHKPAAAQCLEKPTDVVLRTGACNTFWGEDGVICGDNTDVAGFRAAATGLLPTLAGSRVLIVGAGGAAAAAVCALVEDGADSVTLLNRSPDRARYLAQRMDPDQRVVAVVTAIRDLRDADFDLVVNASSVGLPGDEQLPIPLDAVRSTRAVLDLVYSASGATPFVRAARAANIPAADGTAMLLAQGAAAFHRWFNTDAPLDVMRHALTPAP